MKKLIEREVVCLIPTWLTAQHALGAADSLRKYYPNIPIYFVDDVSTEEDINTWNKLNVSGEALDTDSSKLIGYPNSAYILRTHEGYETNGHGNAVTDAMRFIHAKWVLHLSADVRLIKDGCIEYLLKDCDNSVCGSGDDFSRGGPPNLGKWLCLFRGDLYHKYNLNFKANRDKKLDAGQKMFDAMVKKGYRLNIVNSLEDYFIHLTNRKKGHEAEWEKYY